MKKLFTLFTLLLILVLGIGCGSSIEGITISSENNVRSIKVGETLQLTVQVFPEGASSKVEWSSSKVDVASVSKSGLVTALSVGNVEIIATSTVDKNVSKSFTLIIEEGEEIEVAPESIKINAKDDVTTCKVGETISLFTTVSPDNANQAVDWKSSDVTIATVARGEVTALKEGSVTITAASRVNNEIKDSITLTITASSGPVVTQDWANINYTTHAEYMSAEGDTPIKVKGVVTYVLPVKDNLVTYLIQNGTEGYYVYNQDNVKFPVELGKVYEVGGLKKYYRGLNEIVNVEHFKLLDEKIEYTVNKLENIDVSNLEAVEPYHCSIVSGKAVLKNASVNESKAYSFDATIGSYEATFRVDPSYMSEEEFNEINKLLLTAVSGSEFEFTGIMSAFGYGKASPQINVTKASELKFEKLSLEEYLESAGSGLAISSSVSFSKNSITLPSTISGFDDVKVVWESNSDLINVATGEVKHGSENTKVTLTAKLSKDGKEFKKSFEVLVFALDNKTYDVLVSLDLEDAEAPNSYGNSQTKSSYKEGNISLGTPKTTWMLRNALIAGSDSDPHDGLMSIRAQAGKDKDATARIEIQQDGEYNVVEFAVALYGNDDSGIQIKLEYSTDSGANWIDCEEIITVDSKELETYRIKLPNGSKRVAIVVVENSGRRVNIDNIKLMK